MLTFKGALKFLRKLTFAANVAAGNSVFYLESFADGLTANAGGGNTNATLITAQLNRFTASASNTASALLPPAVPGLSLVVINATGAAVNGIAVFPNGADAIDSGSASASQLLVGGAAGTTGTVVTYYCVTSGKWHTQKGA